MMSSKRYYYTLYALPYGDIDTVSEKLAAVFKLRMDRVDSGAWGYYTVTKDELRPEMVSVYSNANRDEEGPYFQERDFPDHPILVSVYETLRSLDIREYILKELNGIVAIDEEDSPPPPEPFK